MELNTDNLMGADELREHLRERMEEIAGPRDLGEANRRCRVLDEWRVENVE